MDLSCRYARGLALPHPLLAASAGTTESVERLARAEEAGLAGAVMKTLFEDPVARRDPAPMFALLEHNAGRVRSSTFYCHEQASHRDPQAYGEEIRRAKEQVGIAVIGSIACMTDEAWAEYARVVEQAGADALELNLSCPFSVHLTDKLDALPRFVTHVIELVCEAVRLPVAAKLTPQMSSPTQIARLMEQAGADAVVPFSRFPGLDVDVEAEAPVMHGGMAGHGGPWALYYVLGWIAHLFGQVSVPISGSGGVWTAEDAVKHLLVGADTVQLCTVLYLQGYEAATAALQGLQEWMAGKGYTSLDQFRGQAARRLLAMHQVVRRQEVVAQVGERCTGCGLCARICLHQAIRTEGERTYRVVAEECTGCGLCVDPCPAGAMALVALPPGYRPRHDVARYYDVLTGEPYS